MKIDRGTNFPDTVSLKNVLNESSSTSAEVSFIWPSAKMPCSRQYSSQQALPIWTPAWPICRDMHSRWKRNQTANKSKTTATFELEGNLIKLLKTFRKPFKNVSHDWFVAKLRRCEQKTATKSYFITLSLSVIFDKIYLPTRDLITEE